MGDIVYWMTVDWGALFCYSARSYSHMADIQSTTMHNMHDTDELVRFAPCLNDACLVVLTPCVHCYAKVLC
jgi:hypothetical protein